jgi:hypothetical protein
MEGLEPITVDPASALQRAMPSPPAPLNPSDILSLQRAGGNRAVARLLAQRKRMTPPLQRQEEEEEELQAKPADQTQRAAAGVVPEVNTEMEDRINAARGRGEPLPEEVREPMEQSLGADLGGVRVHADREADDLSQSLQARAFTTGQDVFFKSSEYQPDSSPGQKLIAHELTHVMQQGGGKLAGAAQRNRISAPVRQRLSQAGRIQREGGGKKKKARPKGGWMDPKFAKVFQKKIEEHHPIGMEILAGIHEELRKEGYEPKEPLPPQEAPEKESLYQTLLDETNKLIDTGGEKTPVLAVKDVKGAGKKITKLLEEFHSKTETQEELHSKWATANSLRDEISKWKKRNVLAFWKKETRQTLNTLDGQLVSETERLLALKQAYAPLRELCQKAKEIDERPLPRRVSTADAVKDIEAKIKDFQSKVLEKLPSEKMRSELVWVLAEKVEDSISALERNQERLERGLLAGPQLEEKRKRFEGKEGKVEKLFGEKGYAGKEGQESLTAFGHKLEALDPEHRDYDKLGKLLDNWLGENAGESLDDFFDWVDRFEAESGTPLDRTRYIKGEDERKKYKLGFKGTQPYYSERTAYYQEKQDVKQRETDKELKHGIYVMTPEGEFYARREMGPGSRARTFHHSSFLAGLPVGAAGKMHKITGGLRVDLDSGHYQPKTRHMLNAVKGLKRKGVPLDNVKVQPFFFEQKGTGWQPSAQEFLDGLKQMKKTNGKEGGHLKLMASKLGKLKQVEEAYQEYTG